jgi:hypothetical protein
MLIDKIIADLCVTLYLELHFLGLISRFDV